MKYTYETHTNSLRLGRWLNVLDEHNKMAASIDLLCLFPWGLALPNAGLFFCLTVRYGQGKHYPLEEDEEAATLVKQILLGDYDCTENINKLMNLPQVVRFVEENKNELLSKEGNSSCKNSENETPTRLLPLLPGLTD